MDDEYRKAQDDLDRLIEDLQRKVLAAQQRADRWAEFEQRFVACCAVVVLVLFALWIVIDHLKVHR